MDLGINQKLPQATAQFTAADGTPVTSFPAPPVWAKTGAGDVTLVPSADGFSCEIDAAALGAVTVTCTATNPDGTTDVLSGDLNVIQEDATGGQIVFGTPVAK